MTAKPPTITPAERKDYTERAAILEYEAGLSRAEAEQRARGAAVLFVEWLVSGRRRWR